MKRTLSVALLALGLGLLVGCNSTPAPTQSPLEGLSQNDAALYEAGQALLEEGVNAFSDLMPQGVSPQAASPRPLTIARTEEEVVLVGSPWRPSPGDPLPPVDKPLSLVIKSPIGTRPQFQANLAYLRQTSEGEYERAGVVRGAGDGLGAGGDAGRPSTKPHSQYKVQTFLLSRRRELGF